MRVYKLDKNLVCTCGHKWGEHRLFEVRNPNCLSSPLVIDGKIAGGCEHNPVFIAYFKKQDETCECNQFKPRAQYVKKLQDEWVKANG